jgi:hypothetical protein
MDNLNRYKLTQEQIDNATAYMVSEGYMDSTDDIISYTRPMVENIDFMVTAKITQWSNSYLQSQTK